MVCCIYFYFVIISVYILHVHAKYSRYLHTSVIEDTCDASTKIKDEIVEKPYKCFIKCSHVTNCRKLMLCHIEDGYKCSLYEDGENCVSPIKNLCQCHRKLSTCSESSCLCPIGYYGDSCEEVITDCFHGNTKMEQIGERLSFIKPEFVKKPFEVLCHMKYGGMLAVVVRRMNCVAVNFNRTWKEYVDGFGHGSTEYWLGLEHIYQLTTTKNFKLNIIIFSSNGYCQDYYTFKIGPASTNYELILIGFVPTKHQPPDERYCGDAWDFQADNPPTPFSTIDHDVVGMGCPKLMAAGGWFFAGNSNCTNGNINGPHVNLEIFNLWNTSPFPFSSVTSMFLRLVN